MHGKIIVSKPLYVALAQRKEERRARLQVKPGSSSFPELPQSIFVL